MVSLFKLPVKSDFPVLDLMYSGECVSNKLPVPALQFRLIASGVEFHATTELSSLALSRQYSSEVRLLSEDAPRKSSYAGMPQGKSANVKEKSVGTGCGIS